MAGLRYKVNKGKRLNGKPRVYFCCHSEDFDLYFETISNVILEKHDCVIWYSDKDTQRDEMFFSDLKQMQLFVVPVTEKFLSTKNDALDVDFRFAIEKHIPVLPLLQEVGLETLFNEKCKNIQYLDKNSKDKTAISYEEKFTKFLQSVLVGDDVADKIRDAFDDRIFLSYRKKDRVYAQELMRKIHKNDFCRDLAIWYDEYLTLGEDFTKEIEEAIDRSRIFALVVTPNIVKDNNYVITDEYPAAIRLEKSILAAEMSLTDYKELRAVFDGIPDTVNAENEDELTQRLSELFSYLIENPSPKTPEHNYYIGLAYLTGLDVEVDKEKALDLIISSASDGFPDAMGKLVNMYENGDGVPVNNDEAIKWRRRLVRRREEIYLKNNTVVALDNWFVSWLELGRALRFAERYSESIEEFEKLYGYCTKELESNKFTEGLVGENREFLYLYFAMMSKSCIGEIHINRGNLKAAQESHSISIELSRSLCDRWPDHQHILREVSTVYKNLGIAYFIEGNREAAMRLFLYAVECKKRLVENCDENLFRLDLSDLYGKIATICKVNNQIEEAIEYQTEGIELVQGGTSLPEKYLHIEGNMKLADMVRLKGNFPYAEDILGKTLELIDEYENKFNEKLNYNKGICWLKLSQIYYQCGQVDNCRKYVLKAIEIGESHIKNVDIFFASDLLLGAYAVYLEVLIHDGLSVQFDHYSKKALKLADEYLAEGAYMYVTDCIYIYVAVGQRCFNCEKFEKAKELFLKAETLIKKYIPDTDNVLMMLPMVSVYLCLGDIYMKEEKYAVAERYYAESANMIEKLLKTNNRLTAELTPVLCYYNIAICCYDDSPQKAQTYFLKTIDYINAIPLLKRTINDEDLLCMSCYGMYCISGGVRGIKWKREWKNKVNEMMKRYPDEFGSTETAQAVLEEYS